MTRDFLLITCSTLLVACLAMGRATADDIVTPEVLQAEQSRVEVVRQATAASIGVFGPGASGGGSGVVISPDGYALTNFHVAQPSGEYMQCTMPDGVLYDAVIVGVDPTGDVALIKLVGRDDFPTAVIGDSDELQVGDWCFTVGNPFLLATDFQPSVSFGIVSGVHRYQYPAGTLLEYADCIQTDAAINPGNSGGPLFNARGELIGINGRGSFEKRGRVNVGVGYAISINQIKKFLGYLKSGRIVDHATLGATVSTDETGAAIVTNIQESSDAYRRGLRYNDEIVSFGGRAVDSANSLKNILGTYPKGWRVPLSYRRDGERYDILVRLGGVHRTEELLAKVAGEQVEPPTPEPKDQPKIPIPRLPEDAPEGEEDNDPDNPRPNVPRPLRRLQQMMKRPKVPDAIAAQLEKRRGYANYYFNELNRDRIWSAFAQSPATESTESSETFPTAPGGEWLVRGKTGEGDSFEASLREHDAFLSWQGRQVRLDLDGDPLSLVRQRLLLNGRVVEDIGMDHGILMVLSMWRRLLVDGPQQFGDVTYIGTAPIPGHDPLVDVLAGTRGVVDNHFWFAPDTGGMLGLEAYYDVQNDPVEIYFSEPVFLTSNRLPEKATVHLGDDVLELSEMTVVVPESSK
jgi:S1-C subfamily serine protease